MTFTVTEACAWGAARVPAGHERDAAYLLRVAMGCDAAHILTHGDETLTDESQERYREMIERRRAGEPVQYIVGKQEFFGLELVVTPDVLIPRPETEHVVEAVLARAGRHAELRIADVGTGSGAIAIALATQLPRATILATDISEAALHVATKNAEKHHVAQRITFSHSDLLPKVAGDARFDFVVSNPPYVGEQERGSLPREVRDFEPAQALFAGNDGLDIYRRLIPAARAALKPGGWLVMEMGVGQEDAVRRLMETWSSVSTVRDMAGHERVIVGRFTPSDGSRIDY